MCLNNIKNLVKGNTVDSAYEDYKWDLSCLSRLTADIYNMELTH